MVLSVLLKIFYITCSKKFPLYLEVMLPCTVDQENFAVKIISWLRPTTKHLHGDDQQITVRACAHFPR